MVAFYFSYQFTSSCPVFLSVRLRLVRKLCRTLSSVSLLCVHVAGRMGREAGPLAPGQHVRVNKNHEVRYTGVCYKGSLRYVYQCSAEQEPSRRYTKQATRVETNNYLFIPLRILYVCEHWNSYT